MTKTLSLKALGRRLKKTNEALSRARRFAKGEETPLMTQIKEIISNIELEIATRQNPSNAIRNALPKKRQRELGMMLPVGTTEDIE
jgi:hypothetical protein